MLYSNIIYNKSPNYGIFDIRQSNPSYLSNCIFQSNDGILFFTISTTINFNNCWIKHNSNSLGVSISIKALNTNTFLITHFNTIYCFALVSLYIKINSKYYFIDNFNYYFFSLIFIYIY